MVSGMVGVPFRLEPEWWVSLWNGGCPFRMVGVPLEWWVSPSDP